MSRMDYAYFAIVHRYIAEQYVGDLLPPEHAGYADTLKVSASHSGVVKVGIVAGGSDDCVDIDNHCFSVTVEALRFQPRGKHVATVRGGSWSITLRGLIRGGGKVSDVELGGWSEQCSNRTTGVFLDLRKEDGSPVRVRVWHADSPHLMGGGPYIVTRVPRGIVALFFAWKHIAALNPFRK